jgi:hypothetical protein
MEVLMSFFNRFAWIFTSPDKVFEDITEGKAPWWQPWVWISIISIIAGYFYTPVTVAVIELNPNGLPPEQLDQQLRFAEMTWLQLITPIVVLIMSLIVAGLSYILVSILSEKANFKKYFTLSLYAGIVSTLTTVVTTLVIRMKGIDSIQTPADARFSLGLGFLAPEEGALIRALLTSIDFFTIWVFILMVLGLQHIFSMSRKHAVYCIIPLWILNVIFSLIQEVTGGMG